MTDRELLELAAKARGNIRIPDGLEDLDISITEIFMDDDSGCWWNPLTDDGDALRLAVKLGAHIDIFASFVNTSIHLKPALVEVNEDTSRYAAARLSIVRAAAEVGKAMP